ncbi:hypothetical protein ASG30_16510 [Ramlibacter sp. Leaf400]|nr:hypothetical protein ASG30_16510 [Ramlibacter sp. Leaf400]
MTNLQGNAHEDQHETQHVRRSRHPGHRGRPGARADVKQFEQQPVGQQQQQQLGQQHQFVPGHEQRRCEQRDRHPRRQPEHQPQHQPEHQREPAGLREHGAGGQRDRWRGQQWRQRQQQQQRLAIQHHGGGQQYAGVGLGW